MANQEINYSGKGSFVFYESFYEGLMELEPKDRLEMFEAIARFGLYGEEPNYTGLKAAYWKQIKTNISSAQKRYRTTIENGKKGGAPVGNDNASKGRTCRKCTHRKTCKDVGVVDAEICVNFLLSSQNNPKQPNSTQNYLNDNDNINDNINDNKNDNLYCGFWDENKLNQVFDDAI